MPTTKDAPATVLLRLPVSPPARSDVPSHRSLSQLPPDPLDSLPPSPSPLDPYYFGLQSPALSPLPPLPPPPDIPPSTPDLPPLDRRTLVGVGELTTPRWDREPDVPDSPWTIEAVDGELSDHEEVGCPIWPSALPHLTHLVPRRWTGPGGGERRRRDSIPASFSRPPSSPRFRPTQFLYFFRSESEKAQLGGV